ncbi:7-carboxy-7-deazaguanine synthase [Chromobacterium phragmitis]|uniref:7-carboxy-7-deazaguanine synthase n=1 Tax=Chromobacterium phragmitis TaxID=2202141 RepID=A0ABV0IZ16_9NEIS
MTTYTIKEIFYTLQGEGRQAGRAAVFCRFAGCNLWSGREEDRAKAVCQFCDTDFVGAGPDGGKFDGAAALAARMFDNLLVKPVTASMLFDAIADARAGAGRREAEPAALENRAPRLCGLRLLLVEDKFCDTDFVGAGPDGGKFDGAAALAARIAAEWPQGAGGVPYVVCTGGEPLLQLDAALIDALHAEGFEIAVETNGTIAAPEGIDWICVSPKAGSELQQCSGDELKLVYPQIAQLPETVAHLDFGTFYLQPMDGPQLADNTRAAIAYCMAHPQWRLSVQTHKVVDIR